MKFRRVWQSKTDYKIEQIRDDGCSRWVDLDYEQLLKWLADGNILEEVPPGVPIEASTEEKWQEIRTCRNRLLLECDWTDLPHAPLDLETVGKWMDYRQALRDIPDTNTDPDAVTWPVPPA